MSHAERIEDALRTDWSTYRGTPREHWVAEEQLRLLAVIADAVTSLADDSHNASQP